MNQQLLLLINGWAGKNQQLDSLMIFFAQYVVYVVFLVAVLCVGLLLYERQWKSAGYFFLTLAVSFLLLQVAGLFPVDHRPFMDFKLTQLVAHEPGSSFPSDHTTVVAAIGIGLGMFTRFKKIGLTIFITAGLIGFSRVFVGIHYPADILGGLVVGLLGGGFIAIVSRIYTRVMISRTSD